MKDALKGTPFSNIDGRLLWLYYLYHCNELEVVASLKLCLEYSELPAHGENRQFMPVVQDLCATEIYQSKIKAEWVCKEME